jgi:NitT/TauT family transport system permease protein
MTSWLGRRALQVSPALAIVLIRHLIIRFVPRYEFFIGSPLGIAREFGVLVREENLPVHVAVTGVEAILGFLAGCVLGTAVGLALWGSRRIYEISRPYLIALGSVPVFAFGPVLIFWFGTGLLSKIVLGFLSTFVIAVVQAHTGASEADPNLLRVVKAFGGTQRQAFLKIIVPSATIWVLSGIRLNIGMALLGAFIGEFISSRRGLGHLIIVAEGLYNVNQIWVGTICIVCIAMVFHACTMPIERWAKRWQ